jgi:hypothetical protein
MAKNVFQQVTKLLKQAVRETLDTLRAKHPSEHFYAFALYDADGDCVCPSTNSEERYRAMVKGIEDEAVRFMYRWGIAEWAYECQEYGPFNEARELLQNAPRGDYHEFQARSFEASITALKELADEGYFGKGDKRLTIFFTLSDDNNAPWLERESARYLNPPELFETFATEHQKKLERQSGGKSFKIDVDDELAKHLTLLRGE